MSNDEAIPSKRNKRSPNDPKNPHYFTENSIAPIGIPEYEGGIGRSLEEHLKFIGRDADYFSGQRVLDIGTGPTGRFARGLHEKNPDTFIVSLSPDLASEEHRTKYVESGALDAGPAVAGIGQKLPFADGSFTRAVSVFMMSYLPVGRMVEVIREMGRVLAPGGEGIITPIILLKNQNSEGYQGMRVSMQRFSQLMEVIHDLQEHDDGAFPHIQVEEATEIYPDGKGDPDVQILRLVVTPRTTQ